MDVFITIVLVLFFIVWLLGRYMPRILLWWLGRKMSKMGEESFRANDNYNEGDVIINQKREEKIMDNTIGEYVDFEETKE